MVRLTFYKLIHFFFLLYFLVAVSRVRQGGHMQRISQLTDLLQWLVMNNLKCYLIKIRTCIDVASILSSVAVCWRWWCVCAIMYIILLIDCIDFVDMKVIISINTNV